MRLSSTSSRRSQASSSNPQGARPPTSSRRAHAFPSQPQGASPRDDAPTSAAAGPRACPRGLLVDGTSRLEGGLTRANGCSRRNPRPGWCGFRKASRQAQAHPTHSRQAQAGGMAELPEQGLSRSRFSSGTSRISVGSVSKNDSLGRVGKAAGGSSSSQDCPGCSGGVRLWAGV